MAEGIPMVFFSINEFFALSHYDELVWASVNLSFYSAVLAGIFTQTGLRGWLIWAARLILEGN
jgi:heme exporter protein D